MGRPGATIGRFGACLASLALALPCPAASPPDRVEFSLGSPEPLDPEPPRDPLVRPAQVDPGPPERPPGSPLDRPIERPTPGPEPTPDLGRMLFGLPFRTPTDPPPGFSGRSSVRPTEEQSDPHFVPVEDRWRIGSQNWDRYGKGHPPLDDYPYTAGRWFDPFHQSVLKGDYPIVGQHTFLNVSGSLLSFQEYRQVPTATTAYESTARSNEPAFYQRPNQFFSTNFFTVGIDLTHGDAAFKPVDWRLRLAPVFNLNDLSVQDRAITSPNVVQGTTRARSFWSLQEAFVEAKLADTSPDYDFISARLGSQPFISDFRGFLFADINDALRVFGTRNANRDQYNVAFFRQRLKDTNSQLNTFKDRGQNILIANYYRQDFLIPGYTAQVSVAFNQDQGPFGFNKNRFLVRPDPTGIVRPHEVDAVYLGWAGDGHVGRYNLTHQFYWALGHDSRNPLANKAQTINAQMFAIEGAYDRDWARFRASFFWASGDRKINDGQATGFDTILDAPVFAGGAFSYWNRQQIQMLGVNLKQRFSLVPDLRSDKFQGQANFVNPGLILPTLGADFDLTPRLRMLTNLNFLWFDRTNALQQYLFQGNVHHFIGYDLSSGFEYRPFYVENAVVALGSSVLLPGLAFEDIYSNGGNSLGAQFGGFISFNLSF